jgi:hypothetical protein
MHYILGREFSIFYELGLERTRTVPGWTGTSLLANFFSYSMGIFHLLLAGLRKDTEQVLARKVEYNLFYYTKGI